MALKMLPTVSNTTLARKHVVGASFSPSSVPQLSRRSPLSVLIRATEDKGPRGKSPKASSSPPPPPPSADAAAPPPPSQSTSAAAPPPPSKAAESSDDMTKKVEELFAKAQNKWESIPDSEKPAAIAIVIASVVAQIAIGATVDAVDRIPLISPFLEFVGLAVTSVYAYRYATDPAEREGAQASFDSFTKAAFPKMSSKK